MKKKAESKAAKKRILIVDDEEAILRAFKHILASAFPQCLITVAEDGAVAMETFSIHYHDIVILDLMMPVMDGQRTLYEIEVICENRNWEMPHVIFCTGFVPPSSVRDLVETKPFCSLLLKPVSRKTLIAKVKACLGEEAADETAGDA